MYRNSWKCWIAAVLSAGLLELPFPLAGPLSPERAVVAWSALAPLIWAVMFAADQSRRPLRTAFLLGYLCGVLWYVGNCYWIYDTMLIHGGLSPLVSVLLLVGFSLVLGLYFGIFGLGVAYVHKRLGVVWALAAAPVFWTALELAAARITCVPWDQLGYSQVDNAFLTQLAPFTGVYGISFVLMVVNSLLASAFLFREHVRRVASAMAAVAIGMAGTAGMYIDLPKQETSATAVLVQPNLDVASVNVWNSPEDWEKHIGDFRKLAEEVCKPYIAGIPQTDAPVVTPQCAAVSPHPDLVIWPEAPAFSFFEGDPRFRQTMTAMAKDERTTLIVGGVGGDYSDTEHQWHDYNSAMIFGPEGKIGRYDKIHLVPYGEYIPYRNLFSFAHKLTGKVEDWSRGTDHTVFRIRDQKGVVDKYGIFICYEAVFADEVREFARNGAEVLVNISDDGWYGDTSAPWQHLNMARMRAIENRRWLLRDTNNGITAVIDPSGQVRQSIPRHQVDALPAQFGFRDDVTIYSAFGDVFAYLCAILSVWFVLRAVKARRDG